MEPDPKQNKGIDETLILNRAYYEQLKDQLSCTICSRLLEDPLMCSVCETPFCGKCINDWLARDKSCPLRCENSQVRELNRSLKKILDGLKLKCKYNCEVSLLSYNSHVKSCEESKKEVPCWNCGKKGPHEDLKVKSGEEYEKLKAEIAELKAKLAGFEEQKNNIVNINAENPQKNDSLIQPADLENIRKWVGKPGVKLERIYKGSTDGFSSGSFHQKCDKKGHSIVVMKTNFDKIIGGYSVIDWISPPNTGKVMMDPSGKSFLFSLTLNEKYPLKKGEVYAVCSNRNYGPIFGNYDLLTVTDCNKNQCLNFDIGTSYVYKGDINLFYGGTPYHLKEIEVYQVTDD